MLRLARGSRRSAWPYLWNSLGLGTCLTTDPGPRAHAGRQWRPLHSRSVSRSLPGRRRRPGASSGISAVDAAALREIIRENGKYECSPLHWRHLCTIMRIVEICYLLPAVEPDCIDDRLVVVGAHADGKVQEARGRSQNLKGCHSRRIIN